MKEKERQVSKNPSVNHAECADQNTEKDVELYNEKKTSKFLFCK